jgi:hypothetical protein
MTPSGIRPVVYVPLDLKKLAAVGHPHKSGEKLSKAFVLPRALFALAFVGYVVFGVACCWLPPLAAEEAAGVAIPSDASCLRATRNADYTTVEIGVGTPATQMSLLLRLDSVLEANSSTAAMRLFSQEALESSTVSCSSSGECEDILLLSHGVNSGFRFAVGRFGYTHPALESSVASGLSGVAGELRLREGNAYWLTATHFCWKNSHAGPSSGGLQTGLSASRRMQASVEALAAYKETSNVPAAYYAPGCDAVANASTVELFPVSAGIESSWLSITNGGLYNSEPDSVEQRRLVAEVGVSCAANVSAMQGALSLYTLDCTPYGACSSGPNMPFRRVAFFSAFLDAGSAAPRIWLGMTDTLRQLPKLASATEAFWFSVGKLALITLCAAIVYVRSRRPTASSSWLFKHCMRSATVDGQRRRAEDNSLTPFEDMVVGGIAVLARITIVVARSVNGLVADGQSRVIVTEAIGSLISAVHWVLRYLVLKNLSKRIARRAGELVPESRKELAAERVGELPISKLGGSSAIIDSSAAVMLAFSETPILVVSLGKFDPTARLLVGILMSIIVVSRAAFSACCCGILLDAEGQTKDKERAPYIRILAWSGGAWVVQSLCLSVLMADTLVTPAAYSMSRSLVGSQLPSRLLLFAALVCSGLPRLMKTFRNILDDKEHSD